VCDDDGGDDDDEDLGLGVKLRVLPFMAVWICLDIGARCRQPLQGKV
jgi:hypothetical protein